VLSFVEKLDAAFTLFENEKWIVDFENLNVRDREKVDNRGGVKE
jgi:hypothetical protein